MATVIAMATVIVSMDTSIVLEVCVQPTLFYILSLVCKGQFNVFSRYFLFESVFLMRFYGV